MNPVFLGGISFHRVFKFKEIVFFFLFLHPKQQTFDLFNIMGKSLISTHHPSQQPPPPQYILPNVPILMRAALAKASQTWWPPEQYSRLAEHAWQDELLFPSGLSNTLPALEKESVATGGVPCPSSSSTPSPSNLWDFIEPATENSCICAKYVLFSLYTSFLTFYFVLLFG